MKYTIDLDQSCEKIMEEYMASHSEWKSKKEDALSYFCKAALDNHANALLLNLRDEQRNRTLEEKVVELETAGKIGDKKK